MPIYAPSLAEVKFEVLKEGSFAIDCLDISEIQWNVCNDHQYEATHDDVSSNGGYNVARQVRAAIESLLVNHFGEAIDIDEVFRRFSEIITNRLLKDKAVILSMTVSMVRLVNEKEK